VIDPQIKRIAARYSVAFVLFTVAVIIGVWMGMRELAATNQPALPPVSPDAPAVTPATRKELVVDGGKSVSCEGACALESVCGLRDPDACRQHSCDGALRKPSKSDFSLAGAPDCTALAAVPCEEACARLGECKGDHGNDAACTSRCVEHAQVRPREAYVTSRCVIESGCNATCP
jgi:hypothetical protein